MSQKHPELERSGRFMLYFQAVGVCEALRISVQTGQAPGPATIHLVKQMTAEAKKICTGEPIDRLPELDDNPMIVDLLVATEVIRTTMLAFLSPEEIDEQKRSIGFSQN